MHLRCLALGLLTVACGPREWRLEKLPTDGAPGGNAQSAARMPSGAVFAVAFVNEGARLPAGGKRWEAINGPLRSISLPQADGSVYAVGALGGPLYQVIQDELVQVLGTPSRASDFIGKTSDGALWMVGESNVLFRKGADAMAWEPVGTAIAGEAGLGVMRAPGRLVEWNRRMGLLELDTTTHAQSVLLPCSHAALRGCEMTLTMRPGRHGELFFVNSNDSTSSGVELWKLEAGATEPILLAGPTLPGLAIRTDDDMFNRYRPGAPSLYVDTLDRVWLAFRWGANEPDDVTYLYGWVGKGGWQQVSSSLPSNTALGGDGETPLLLNTRDGAAFSISRIVQ